MQRNRSRMSFAGLREMEKLVESGKLKIQRSDVARQERLGGYLGELNTLQTIRTQLVAGMLNGLAHGQMPTCAAADIYDFAEELALEDFKRRLVEAAETLRHLKEQPDERMKYICALAGVDLGAIIPPPEAEAIPSPLGVDGNPKIITSAS